MSFNHPRFRQWAFVTVWFLLLSAPMAAVTITGTVTDGTTHRPAAGDEVLLIKLAAGMEEVGHTKSDLNGRFSFTLADDNAPHLVRAMHQGVAYHKAAPPGTSQVEVEVFDVSKKVEGIGAVADLMYMQATEGQLEVTRIFAIDNQSRPPRTQMSDQNLEFYLPDGAQIDGAQAETAGGRAVNVTPVPLAEKGRYAMVFPLRPGQTEFQVSYHLAYSGKAAIDPRPVYPLQHFVAILPRSIRFVPNQPGIYADKQPPDHPDAIAEVATNTRPGETLSFEVFGEGVLQGQNQNASNQAPEGETAIDRRPGGGLGPPTEGLDPLDRYRWWILGGFGMFLLAGAFYATRSAAPSPPVQAPESHSGRLLNALKEELFQLEIEHKQGRISDQEYAEAKAALDRTLARAVKRHR